MSDKNFVQFIKSKFNRNVVVNEPKPEEVSNAKIHKSSFKPVRRLFLWGFDNNDNPGFAVLYGTQEFKSDNADKNILEDDVTYTHYAIFSGSEGHFPSFEAVKILDTRKNSINKYKKKMYYKKDIEGNGYWYRGDESKALDNFKLFHSGNSITLPYYQSLKHEDYVQVLSLKNIVIDNFRLAKTPAEVLNLGKELVGYYDSICELFGNPKIYVRKKILKELISKHPPKKLYDFLLRVGSSELISGLFLEFALQKNDSLIQEAGKFLDLKINFVSESYGTGLKRCALLYVNSFNEESKKERIKFISDTLSDIDLNVITVGNKELPKDKIIEGAAYRKYAAQGYLSEYSGEYLYEHGKYRYTKIRRSNLYKESYYTDGVVLNINHLKNTIQESEILGLADVIGKIAYYLDAPRLTYYFKGNGNTKALIYFRRYVRRILDTYANHDELRFIEAMKILLTSYTEADYLCKFKGNFQFNYFIKHYLYNDYKEKAPTDWRHRHPWFREDQLLKLVGRYDFMKDLWNRHLEDVIDIISHAKINTILKAFYYILKDSVNQENLSSKLSYENLIKLVSSPYEPISELFIDILKQKLKSETNFDIDIMFHFIQSEKKILNNIGMDYFKRTGGIYSADGLVGFLFLKNLEFFIDLLAENINKLDTEDYFIFIYGILDNIDRFIELEIIWSEDLIQVLDNSIEKLIISSIEQKSECIRKMMDKLMEHQEIPGFILDFMEKLIFSIPYQEIKSILKEQEIDLSANGKAQRNQLIVSLLKAMKNNDLPFDSQVLAIIESGTSKITKALIRTFQINKEQLFERLSTTLLLLESDVTPLCDLAKEIFDHLQGEKQKKLLSMLIDSPDQKVYEYGLFKLKELYENKDQIIPEELLIQMLEHSSFEVKQYISDKVNEIIGSLGNGNKELFMYYAKTLLFMPNKYSKGKKSIYETLPVFAARYADKKQDIYEMLLNIGGSNCITDSERALVALAKIEKEVV